MVERYDLLIANKWVGPGSGTYLAVENPATGETEGEVAAATPADVDQAVTAASTALEHSDWAHNPRKRSAAMRALARKMTEHLEALASSLTRENGKSLTEARAEVQGAIDSLEFYGGLCRALYGRVAETIPDSYSIVLREPVGVVAVIAPWNWPVTLMMRSLAPALATGNTAIVKPASYTPITTLAIAKLAMDIEQFPPGVINVITGSGAVVGDALVAHPGVDMVAFTGDTVTGQQVMRTAAGSVKKVSLELGGKSPNIVFADANLDKAVPGAISAAFTTAGQICTAGSRLLVEASIHAEFVSRLKEAAEAITVGNGLQPGIRMGPIASKSQLERVMEFVELGRREARLVTGGARLQDGACAHGYFVSPTIFDGVAPDSRLAQEEIFGPVLCVMPFRTEAEAIALANNSQFGLAAGLWTQNVDRIMRVSRAIKAGTIWVNTYHQFYNEAEVGGYKRSGIGRHQGLEVLNEFSELKHINLDIRPNWNASR